MIYKPITTLVCADSVLRFWRYDDFALDYMLAQQLNYEFLIYFNSSKNECKHIVQANDIWLTTYAVVLNLQRYDIDLR